MLEKALGWKGVGSLVAQKRKDRVGFSMVVYL